MSTFKKSGTENSSINADLLSKLNTQQIIALIELCKEKLRQDGIIRTDNLLGDYTEFLVSRSLGLKLQKASSSGFDAVDSKGYRYQIKGRRMSKNRTVPHIKRFENLNFDYLVLMIFNRDYSVFKSGIVSKDDLSDWIRRKSKNGNSLNITKEFLNNPIFREMTLSIS
jgi:hypothetical protein